MQISLNQPIYKILEQTGPQHDKIYKIEVFIGERYQWSWYWSK